jgi:hypothetical protein
MKFLIVLLTALMCSGCFVVDEIEAGREIMEAHNPNSEPEKAKEGSPGAPQTARQRLADYYAEQRAKASSGSRDTDAADEVGRCRIGGSTEFLRRSDCQVRGGTFL